MGYGVNTVVGGWSKPLQENEVLPYTIARTEIEHRQLRTILNSIAKTFRNAVEFGCGYGRNLYTLNEFAVTVHGFERDEELRMLAKNIWSNKGYGIFIGQSDNLSSTHDPSNYHDLVFSYTLLQHIVDESECKNVIDEMQRVVTFGGLILICEEQDKSLHGSVKGRSTEEYAKLFDKCERENFIVDREVGLGKTSAKYLLFRRKNGTNELHRES